MTSEQHLERFLLAAVEDESSSSRSLVVDHVVRVAELDLYYDSDGKAEIVKTLVSRSYMVHQGRPPLIGFWLTWTPAGLEKAKHLRKISQQKAERDQYLHNVLVRWAYEHTPAGGSARLEEFAEDERWWFAGTQVTWPEVHVAVDYLEAENLLAGGRASRYSAVEPTPLGIKFALTTMTLRMFMTTQQPQPSSVTNNFNSGIVVHGSATGSNFATGGGNTQSLAQGVDADGLASLVAHLRQVASDLPLSQDDARDLAEDIDALEREGAEPSRGRRIWRAIVRILTPALTQAATAGSEHVVRAAIERGAELFS
ncbi:hypothetical protein ACFV2H_45385 [Streptomyces sp. NPDC059629]|uniref:hypothetical protein n=1 Tax=Streptomyces sp. NPDC059629 TaxID=3346889 RepID=UPI0036B708C1